MDFIKSEAKMFAKGLKHVFSSFIYLALALIIAILTAYIFVRLTSVPGQSLESWLFSVTDTTKWFVALYSILMGMLIAIEVYIWLNLGLHLPKTTKRAAGGVLPGLFSGIIGVACCAPAIAGIALLVGGGVVGFIARYQLLFAIPSLLLMLAAMHFALRAVADPTCRL